MDQFSKAMIPGAWLVDMVPMRKLNPYLQTKTLYSKPALEYN